MSFYLCLALFAAVYAVHELYIKSIEIGGGADSIARFKLVYSLYLLISVAVTVGALTFFAFMCVRRFRDMGKSEYWVLVMPAMACAGFLTGLAAAIFETFFRDDKSYYWTTAFDMLIRWPFFGAAIGAASMMLILAFICGVFPGDKGPNHYGPNPRGEL